MPPVRSRRVFSPALLALGAFLILGMLFVPECDDCYFVYWRFASLRDLLLTRPVTQGLPVVGVPENGRYLGNLLGVLQGKLYFTPLGFFRGLLLGGALGGTALLLARRLRSRAVGGGEALALALALVVLAPRGIWQEVYSWGAGLVNYLLPMAGALLLLDRLAGGQPAGRGRRLAESQAKKILPLFLISAACCLFMEPVTIWLALFGAGLGICLRSTPKRRAGLAVWLGSWLGAALMFSAPGYRQGTNEARRAGLDLAADNLRAIVAHTLIFPAAVTLLISLLLVWLIRRQGGRWRLLAAGLVPVHVLQLSMAWANLLQREPPPGDLPLWTGLGLALLWVLLLLQWRGREGRALWLLVLSLGVLNGPLLFVTPIGARNFFPAYLILSLIACLLYRAARAQGFLSLSRSAAVLTALALALLLGLYACNALAYHHRLTGAQAQAAAGAEELTLPLLPFSGWAINEHPGKGDLSYLIYRQVPWDVRLEFVPWDVYFEQ